MPNALQKDPTRTVLLRKRFIADMVRRFKRVAADIVQALVEADALGLAPTNIPAIFNVDQQAWRFQTNPQKVKSFRSWLKGRVDANILVTTGPTNKPWTAEYVEASYRKGVLRAYTQSRRDLLLEPEGLISSREEFLRSSFSGQTALSKVELLYERAFTELEGVTATMDQQLSRILAEGLSSGRAPAVIAREMTKQITKLTNTRAKVIARTEVIRAHAEGQLDSFQALGVEKLIVKAEWITAGDERVCAICADLEGTVFTIEEARGLIPEHPNCRCMWIPADVGEKRKAA